MGLGSNVGRGKTGVVCVGFLMYCITSAWLISSVRDSSECSGDACKADNYVYSVLVFYLRCSVSVVFLYLCGFN
jgi:biotin transporter BioY